MKECQTKYTRTVVITVVFIFIIAMVEYLNIYRGCWKKRKDPKMPRATSKQNESPFNKWYPLTRLGNISQPNKKSNPVDLRNSSNINENLIENSFTISKTEIIDDSIQANTVSITQLANKIVDNVGTLNNHRKGTMAGRSKRSVDKKSNCVDCLERVPRSDIFYRHPNLSYEEQRKQINITPQSHDRNLYTGSEMNQSKADVQSSLKSDVNKIESPTRRSKGHRYVPVFPGCDDANNSTMENYRNNGEKRDELSKANRTENNPTLTAKKKSRKSIEQSKRNKGYINIRDLQRNTKNPANESTDIPKYDPNKIPYVDVPDYTDIREESLDEQDRKANRNRIMEKEVESMDGNFKDAFKSLNNHDRDIKRGKLLKNSEQAVGKEKHSEQAVIKEKNVILVQSKPSVHPKGKPNFFNSQLYKSEQSGTDPYTSRYSKDYQREQNNQDKVLKGMDQSFKSQNDSNETTFRQRQTLERDNSEEDSNEGEGYQGGRSGPIIFDINEYRKPFDLDEFLKDDPIMKKLTAPGKETRAKYGKNGKRVSSDFNESESVNAYKERDEPTKSRRPAVFMDRLTRKGSQIGEESSEENNDEDYPSDSPLAGFGEEFVSKRFTDDIVKNLPMIKENREGKDSIGRGNEDKYNASAAILNEKTSVPGSNEGRIKATDVPVVGYDKFWSLEYKSTGKRVDMEAQERRK